MTGRHGRVVALAGGVGGARLADGLAQALPSEALTVIVNTGDDFEHLGLAICPDLDTVCYTLAGLANPETGWGRSQDSFLALETLVQLGGPAWFNLGDLDLGLHLERTRRIRAGDPLSMVTAAVCAAFGVQVKVLPATNDPVPTWVLTREGELPFQEYFVRLRCEPCVTGFRFSGAEQALPAPGVVEALQEAELVVICPSNPLVSVDPILAIPGIRQALTSRVALGSVVVAVSPIIGGVTVKGPAAKMFRELGIIPSALAVARHYQGLLTGFVLDAQDAVHVADIQALGVNTLLTDILMKDRADRRRLAQAVLDFAWTLHSATISNKLNEVV